MIRSALQTIILGLIIFFHPKSPAAIYKNPYPFVNQLYARLVNQFLKLVKGDSICIVCGFKGRFGFDAPISTNNLLTNESCLKCHSNKRTRTVIYYFQKNLLKKNSTILDIGPLKSTRQFFQNYKVTYVTLDKYGDANYHDDITNMKSLNNRSIDYILCVNVLEHIQEDIKAMKEMQRILKPKGLALITIPKIEKNKKSIQNKISPFKGYGHVWRYGSDFTERLRKAGFTVRTIQTNSVIPSQTQEKYGLDHEICLYICKPL